MKNRRLTIIVCLTVAVGAANFAPEAKAVSIRTPNSLGPNVQLLAIGLSESPKPIQVGFWKAVKKRVRKGIKIPLNPPGGWKF